MANGGLTDFSIAAIMEDKSQNKPQLSYAALIIYALRSSPAQCLTLQGIYDYIKNNFPFYQNNLKSWQNSVRHALSTSKYFVQVERSPNDPGRGNYWTLSPEAYNIVIGADTGRVRHQPQDMNQMIPHVIPVCPELYFMQGQPGMYPVQNPGGIPVQPYQYQNGGYVPMAHPCNGCM